MSRKARAFSYPRFSNKNSLAFLAEVSIISNFSAITEVLVVIKTSDEKHQNIIKFSINSALDVDIDHAFRQYYYAMTIISLLFE